jgi:hypothetical protein
MWPGELIQFICLQQLAPLWILTPDCRHKTDTSETARATPRDKPHTPDKLGFTGKTVSQMITPVGA